MTERRKSSIGKYLKGLSTASDKPSLVSIIDKACSEGEMSSGAFSVLGIKRKMRSLLSLLEDSPFDRDAFFSEFNSFYSLVMAPDRRAVGVFHPSQLLSGCPRQSAFEIMGVSPSSCAKTIKASLQRTFDVGTWYHLYIQAILYRAGVLEGAEVPVINKERFLNGKADGVIKSSVFGERVVLEIKTMNSWVYAKAPFSPYTKHEFQASLYARELGIKKILYLYINKDNSEIKEFLRPVNEEQLSIADEKMNDIISHVKEGTLPKRICADKFCSDALGCPFSDRCFKE